MPRVLYADYQRLSQFSALWAELAKKDSWKTEKIYVYIYICILYSIDIMIRTISFSKSHKPPCFMRTWIVKQSTMTGAVIVGSLSHSTSSLQSWALRSLWSHSMWNGEIPNELPGFHNMQNIMKATCPFHPCVFGSVRRYLMSQCWKDALLSLR